MTFRAHFNCPLGGQPLKVVWGPPACQLQIDTVDGAEMVPGTASWLAAIPTEGYVVWSDVDRILSEKGVPELDWEAI